MHNPIIPALLAASLQCAAMLSPGASALAQDRTAPVQEPPFILVDTVTEEGTVEAVDRGRREVILRLEDGRVVPVKVDPSVAVFNQISAGDRIRVEFLAATAVSIASPEAPSGSARAAGGGNAAATVAPRDKPAGVQTATVHITATIDEIDYATRRARLRNADGIMRTVHIDERIGSIQRFRKGDTVAIRHTEAVAISVSK